VMANYTRFDNGEIMTFADFKAVTKANLDSGALKVSKPMSDLDMAVQFAIGLIGDECGYPFNVTDDEICTRILTFADDGIFERDSGWFYEIELAGDAE